MSASSSMIIPPIAQVVEPLDAQNEDIYGSIQLSESGALLKRYLTYMGFSDFLTRAYNDWIIHSLPAQIRAYTIKVPGGFIYFDMEGLVNIVPPYQSIDERKPFTPQDARNYESTYYLTVNGNAYFQSEEPGVAPVLIPNTVSGENIPRPLAQIPLMLGSQWDWVTQMNVCDRVQVGECPSDPLGYFIIKGKEKIVLIQEKLRLNRIIVYYPKNMVVKMTIPTIKGTKEMIISQGDKSSEGLGMTFEFMGKNEAGEMESLPLFLVFQILNSLSIDQIYESIFRFVKPEYRRKIEYQLINTRWASDIISNPFEYLSNRKAMFRLQPGQTVAERDRSIRDALIGELFPHINPTTIRDYYREIHPEMELTPELINQILLEKKVDLLSLMVARLTETMAGLRPLDDRDSWSNKRLETAARSMEQLFGSIWKKTINGIQDDLKGTTDHINIAKMINKSSSEILREFESSFNANNWGVSKGPKKKENLTEFLSRDNPLAVLSHITKINTPVSRRGKSISIRLVQMSQLGYVCTAQTPEGELCGITKYMAVTASVTLNQPVEPVIHQLRRARESGVRFEGVRLLPGLSPVIYNGFPIGYGEGPALRDFLVEQRRNRTLTAETAIIFIAKENTLYIYNDTSRAIRPLLIVDESGDLVLEKKGLKYDQVSPAQRIGYFDLLLAEGAMEYLDPWEQEYIQLAQSQNDLKMYREGMNDLQQAIEFYGTLDVNLGPDTLRETIIKCQEFNPATGGVLEESYFENPSIETVHKFLLDQVQFFTEQRKETFRPYTHCEIDPSSQFGIAASTVPLPNYSQGVRATYQAGMAKQALGIYHSNYKNRFDTTSKVLAYPTRPLFETQVQEMLGVGEYAGQNVIVAIMPYYGLNQEDAFILKKSSVDRGLFMMSKISTYEATTKCAAKYTEVFGKPRIREGEDPERYRNLDENGIVKVGSYVKSNDILIGRIRKFTTPGDNTEHDISVLVKLRERGIVRRVFKDNNVPGQQFVKVVVEEVRAPQIGDKIASRYSQKGTIGMILPDADMPEVMYGPNKGMKPDIIINPLVIPSRMTIAKLIEIIASKHGVLKGERINATAFQKFDTQLPALMENLKAYGFDSKGEEILLNGITGKPIKAKIFIGPCYYQVLRHNVKDKIQVRGRGGFNLLTGQPFGGRSQGGGQKVGEMEKDAFISHGASALVQERLCLSSDAYQAVYCKACGVPATVDKLTSQYICRECGQSDKLVTVTLRYAYKLLQNYLSSVGIKLKFSFRNPENRSEE